MAYGMFAKYALRLRDGLKRREGGKGVMGFSEKNKRILPDFIFFSQLSQTKKTSH